jgi:hypothetical protein
MKDSGRCNKDVRILASPSLPQERRTNNSIGNVIPPPRNGSASLRPIFLMGIVMHVLVTLAPVFKTVWGTCLRNSEVL